MARTTSSTNAGAVHRRAQRVTDSQRPASAAVSSASSAVTTTSQPTTVAQNQRVVVQYRTHIWIPGTVISGPVYSTLFQSEALEVEFFEVDGTRTRRYFLTRDVRPALPH